MLVAGGRHPRFDVSLRFPRLLLSEVLQNQTLTLHLYFQYQPHRSVFENKTNYAFENNHLWYITRTLSPGKIVDSTGAAEPFTYTSPMLVSEPRDSLCCSCDTACA